MNFSGPDAIDNAIKAGLDIDGSPLPEAMLKLYREVMEKEAQRQRSGVRKSMRNRIVRTWLDAGTHHLELARAHRHTHK